MNSADACRAQIPDNARTSEKRNAETKDKSDPDSKPRDPAAGGQVEVFVRMMLRADGKVSDVSVVKGGSAKINKLAIKAAKKIKFEPAIKDGHPVSQWVTIKYTFTLDEDKK